MLATFLDNVIHDERIVEEGSEHVRVVVLQSVMAHQRAGQVRGGLRAGRV